ncbi:hypothetical protein GCM10010377_61040 [Streptomyces viridiviolaceus]|uniref:Uncharacterized protein n=1 Tax=Streptomyces viridiviolaceus TaxID=68282 RepID=A0ABW2EEF8_9ACTN|nr:hypothetical protein [Streptomyces viridiviolaceus]GHB61839.1 hypothetical protein GCM10010377_61040 [Streptomyces viridiviolaceus]
MYDQARAQQPPDRPSQRSEHRPAGPEPLLPADERDKITLRLRRALNEFADAPRQALEEAEVAYDDAVTQLANALAERGRALREDWEGRDPATHPDELRHALREYREITQRLLRA